VVQTSYGENGDIWYDAEPSFQAFGTGGYGFANYLLDISYDHQPPGTDPEFNSPVRSERSFFPPLPDFFEGIITPDILSGSFAFEYGVPFSMSSYLDLFGNYQIDMDYDHTATLSLFELPGGASLTSSSGHIYPVSEVPEPSTVGLLGGGLLAFIGFARRKK